MNPLAWLGIKERNGPHPRLTAIHDCVHALLPEDEPVVLRYIVVVAVLLTRVVVADGGALESELAHLRQLFRHIDRMPPEGIERLCTLLHEQVPRLSTDELELCYRELKSLCDADERLQILRLLAEQATSDGRIGDPERGILLATAERLGISAERLDELEIEALSARIPPASLDTPATPEPSRSSP